MKLQTPWKSCAAIRFTALAALLAIPCPAKGQQEAPYAIRLINQYKQISSVSCSVRKTTAAGDSTVRMLSRVYFRQGGFIHVDNVAPSRKRVISDGSILYIHAEELPRGFAKSIKELDSALLTSLQSVPGSPMEHLLKLAEMKEEKPVRTETSTTVAYHGDNHHVRLTLDNSNRVSRIEFFEDRDMKKRFGIYEYSGFITAGETWLAAVHTAAWNLPDGTEVKETRHFDNLKTGTDIPDSLFDHKLFMKDIEFVPDLDKTWQ